MHDLKTPIEDPFEYLDVLEEMYADMDEREGIEPIQAGVTDEEIEEAAQLIQAAIDSLS